MAQASRTTPEIFVRHALDEPNAVKEVAAVTTEIELRLNAAGHTGEIAAADLAALAAALQELITRITSEVVNAAGPCRSKQFIEELSELRLRAVEVGSTVLRFSKGPIGNPNAAFAEAAVADDRFWEAVRAIAEDHRPDWMSDRIAESVVKLVNAIRAVAPTVIIAGASRGEVHIHAAAVEDPAASYLGGRVIPLQEILASAPGPDPDGGIDLTEEQAAAFFAALHS